MKSIAKNILLIAGTGRNSRKTTLACKVIEKFAEQGVVAVKISPHFHFGADGLDIVQKDSGFNIYREKNKNSGKDSARMLRAGAKEVFYIEVLDSGLDKAIQSVLEMLPHSIPLVCESPALRKVILPGVFLVVDHPETLIKKKEVLGWKNLADKFVDTSAEDLEEIINSLTFENNSWAFNP